MKKYLSLSIALLIVAIIYTIAVINIDVAAVGPDGSSVGFSTINKKVSSTFEYNDTWYTVTKYAGILPFFLVAFYGCTGVIQLIKEKSLKRVNKKLILLGATYVVLGAIYILFEKFIVNYRPVLMEGKLEASYPSSHTLLAIVVCASSLMISKDFIKNETLRKIVDILTAILMILIVIGRIISGVHWISDIGGGIIISLCTLSFFKSAILMIEKEG